MKKYLPYIIISAISLISHFNVFAQYYSEVNPSTRVLDKDNYRPGTLPGFIDVNSLGESVYEIPIHVPPGTAGMQPSLSIAYNSNYPDGPLGIGWHIKGLSEIRRVPRNFYHHGMINGVDLQADDIFALDSNRLILTSQHSYGANGSEYRTEVETFSKIIAHGTAGTGPSYFIVETKGGLTLEYGNTSDSKIEASGTSTVYMWRLNKVTDRNGNLMEYLYYEVNGESLIAEIKYTKNPAAGLNSHYNRVVFSYYSSSRSDYNTTYPAGKALPSTKLLESIQILTEGDTLVREYGFKYVLNRYSHLNQITVMGSDGTKFNPTIIGWGEAKTPFYSYGSVFNNNQKNKFHYGDFNGDGRTDVLAIERKASYTSSDKWRLYYANSSGTGFIYCDSGFLSSSFKEFVVADADGDGKDDVLKREIQTVYYQCNPHPCDGDISSISALTNSIITNYVPPPPNDTCWDICSYQTESYLFYKASNSKLTRGSSSYDIPVSSSTAKLLPVDLDGNGKCDFILLTALNNYNGIRGVYLSSGPNFNTPDDIRLLDFDGDGKKELLVHKGTTITIYTWNPATSQLSSIFSSSSWPNNPARVFIGDFNGDKKDDILFWNSNSWHMRISTGSGFVTSTVPSLRPYDPSASTTDNNYYIGDFNGDGKDDILEVYKVSQESRLKVHYSTGGGNFISETNTYSKSIINRDYFTIIDINGDNHADVFYYDYSSTANFVSACYFYAYENRHKVHKITNGLNHKIDLTYTRINALPDFHTPGNSAVYPLRDYNKAYYAVARVREYNDYTDTTKVEYSYQNAMFHAQGKGFLGFLGFSSKSSEDYKSINTFEINETFFFRTPRQFEYYKCFTTHNNLIRDIRYTNNVNNYGSKRFFPFISKTDTWDDLVKTITITNSVYDYDGNLTGSEKRYLDEDSSLVATKRIFNTYNQFGNWGIKNKLTKSITESHYESDTLYRRLITYSYDSNGNLTTQIADSGKTKAVTTSYLINSLGMPYQKTVSSTGLSSRVESYEFDTKFRFVTRVINPGGNSIYIQNYPGTGNIRSHTDINGLRSEFDYDGFGRPKTSINAYENEISTYILWDAEDIISEDFLWSVQTNGTNVPATEVWYDPLGREKAYYSPSTLQSIYIGKKYNSAGQLIQETRSNRTGPSQHSYIKTSFDYDDFGRLFSVSTPGIGTFIHFNGRETTEYLPGYKRRESTTDAMGNVLHIKENNNSNLTTSYVYHSSGQVKQTVSAGNTVTVDFDEYGRPETITSQNSGTEKYSYNAFGELTRTINAKGDTASYSYDNLGRITSITEPEGTTTYSYVTSGNGLQQISSVSGPGVSYSYQYDSYGRLTQLSKTISNGPTLTVNYSYDSNGNIDEITYPGGFAISHLYDINGYLNEIRDAADNTIWKLYALTGSGRPLSYDLGSGNLSVSCTYDTLGYLKTKNIGNWQQTYNFDVVNGNLMERGYKNTSMQVDLSETFTYDNLNRLLTATTAGADTLKLTYDYNGNIASKSDAGTYSYHPSKINAVTSIDGNPSTIPGIDQRITYNSYHKATSICEGSDSLAIVYGPDKQRVVARYYVNSTLARTIYYFGDYEMEVTPSDTIHRHYVRSTTGIAALKVKSGSTDSLYYAGTDHLGSIIALYRNDGSVKEHYSFDAWGRRRNPADWSYNNVPAPALTERGFTGHEHLDKFGLINMNGRLYDPVLGRFLNADPVIQFPGFTQSYNSYSYVMNNPLRFTDPTGYSASMDAFTEAGLDNRKLAEKMRDLFGEMYYDVYLSHLFDEEYQGPIYQGPIPIEFRKDGYYLNGKKLTTEEAQKIIEWNTAIANAKSGGDRPIFGYSADLTLALGPIGGNFEIGEISKIGTYTTYGLSFGLEASYGVNLVILLPKSNFARSNFFGKSAEIDLNLGSLLSIAIGGDKGSIPYSTPSWFNSYTTVKIGIGIGTGGSYSPNSTTIGNKFLDYYTNRRPGNIYWNPTWR